MRRGIRLWAASAVMGLLISGCVLGTDAARDAGARDERRVCELGFGVPAGFEVAESFREAYPDHVGIRLGLVSDDGRELHVFAGIPGEFGEGLPVAGSVEAAPGVEGVLRGSDGTWVLTWQVPGPCGPRAALGTGFTRPGFLRILREAGAIPSV